MWAMRASPPTDKPSSGLVIKCGAFAVIAVLMIALVFAKFYGINIIIAIMLFALCSLVIIGALAETKRETFPPVVMSTIRAPPEGGGCRGEEEEPPPPYHVAIGMECSEGTYQKAAQYS